MHVFGETIIARQDSPLYPKTTRPSPPPFALAAAMALRLVATACPQCVGLARARGEVVLKIEVVGTSSPQERNRCSTHPNGELASGILRERSLRSAAPMG